MRLINVENTPSQTIDITLASQPCTIKLYEKTTGVFCDVLVNDKLIIGGVICHNSNLIVRDVYLGFIGDLFFYDTMGKDDPTSVGVNAGLGSRYQFYYAETTDF